ncbi:hypothetical protein PPYR_14835, partial [Photinus pyralis]
MILPNSLRGDFNWWKDHIGISVNPIIKNDYFIEIFSDASLTGWGAVCGNKRARGFRKREECVFHINYLELLSSFFALKCFTNDLMDCSLLLRLDNTTAISYINKMGGIQHTLLSDLSKEIWQWCESRNLWIFAS